MTSTTQAQAEHATANRTLRRSLVIGLISFLTLVDLFGAQALLPSLTAAYGVDPGTMGFAINTSTIGMAVAGLVVALLSRHIPRKTGIWISLALLAIPTSLLGVTENITTFMILRIVQGALMSTAFTLTIAYLAEECSASEAAIAMAAYITGNVASNLIGRLCAALAADTIGLNESFFLFATLNVCGAILAYLSLSQTSPREAAGASEGSLIQALREQLGNPALGASFSIGFLILFVFIGVFTYVNFVLSAAPFALSATALGIVYFVFLPAIFTTPVAGWMVARHGTRRTIWLSMGLAGLGVLLLLTPYLGLVLTGLAAVGVGTFCAQAATTGFVGRAARSDRASASGLYLSSYYVGGLIGSLVLGRIFDTLGWSATVLAIVLAILISGLVATRLIEPETAKA